MKCSDVNNSYYVPKVMCSICIEEYAGYGGGYLFLFTFCFVCKQF